MLVNHASLSPSWARWATVPPQTASPAPAPLFVLTFASLALDSPRILQRLLPHFTSWLGTPLHPGLALVCSGLMSPAREGVPRDCLLLLYAAAWHNIFIFLGDAENTFHYLVFPFFIFHIFVRGVTPEDGAFADEIVGVVLRWLSWKVHLRCVQEATLEIILVYDSVTDTAGISGSWVTCIR